MNVVHVAARELRSAFTTVVGWMVLCAWLAVSGVSWLVVLGLYLETTGNLVYDPYGATHLTLGLGLFAPFFGNCVVMLVLLVPVLAMRSFSEEMSKRTLELLLTSPIGTGEIVLGKFLGLVGILAILLAGTLQFPLGLSVYADLDWGALAASYLGVFLLASSLAAMGMLASSFTSNQVVAAGTSFAAALALVLADMTASEPDGPLSQISITSHVGMMLTGAVRLSDVVYYLALTGFCLFATHQRMESFRWR